METFETYLQELGAKKVSKERYIYKDNPFIIMKDNHNIYVEIYSTYYETEDYSPTLKDEKDLEVLIKRIHDYQKDHNSKDDISLVIIEGLHEEPYWEWCTITSVQYYDHDVKLLVVISQVDTAYFHFKIKDVTVKWSDTNGNMHMSNRDLLINILENEFESTSTYINIHPPFLYKMGNKSGRFTLSSKDIDIPTFKYKQPCGNNYIFLGNHNFIFQKYIEIPLYYPYVSPYTTGAYLKNYLAHAAHVIQRQWRKAIADPNYKLCRDRLMREYITETASK
jgi:hypothetical protein